MTFVLGIVAEIWERAYAWATIRACLELRSGCRHLLVPDFLLPLPVTSLRDIRVEPVACGVGFAAAADVAEALRTAAQGRPLLLVSAGALRKRIYPGDFDTSEVRGAFRWHGPGSPPRIVRSLSAPVHRPPALPRHRHHRCGRLDVWEVDTGCGYFQSIDALSGLPPVFPAYGEQTPIFAYSTNEFLVRPPPPQEQYVILGSGLLGLRLIVESRPISDACIVVYDINPGALTWIDYLLVNADSYETLPDLIAGFTAANPTITVRPVAPHERDNARAQESWYRQRRNDLVRLRELARIMVAVDIFTAPEPLFRRLRRNRRTMMMYLDLFVPWIIDGARPWVCNATGLARSLETAVREVIGGDVQFVPDEHTPSFQISPISPFLSSCEEAAPCT